MKLSEKIESVIDSGEPPARELLESILALAKRVESSPVASLKWDWFSKSLAQGVVRIDRPSDDMRENVLKVVNANRVALVILGEP